MRIFKLTSIIILTITVLYLKSCDQFAVVNETTQTAVKNNVPVHKMPKFKPIPVIPNSNNL